MAIMRKISLLLSLLVLFVGVSAQQLSNADRRAMNIALLQAIDKYEFTCAVHSGNAEDFVALFESSSLNIYNDLLGLSSAKTLPVKQYAELLKSKANRVDIDIIDVKRRDFAYDGNVWTVAVEFLKRISYENSQNIIFSSNAYFGAPHRIIAEYVYNPNAENEDERFVIKSLQGSVDSDKPMLPEQYDVILFNKNIGKESESVIEKMQKTYTNVRYNRGVTRGRLGEGSHLEFDDYGQAFVPCNMTTKGYKAIKYGYSTWDEDIFLHRHREDNIVSLTSKRKVLRLKFRGGATIGNAFSVNNLVMNGGIENYNIKSFATEAGLDFGVMFKASKRGGTRMGFFLGAAYCYSTLSFNVGEYQYAYKDADCSGAVYERNYRLTNIKQGYVFKDIAIPLYMSFEHRLARRLSLNWALGAKMYYNLASETTYYKMNADVWGDYGTYVNYGDSGNNNDEFGMNQIFWIKDYIETPENVSTKTLSFSAIGTLGFNIFLSRSIILNLNVGYEYGVSRYGSYNEKGQIQLGSIGYNPIIYVRDKQSARECATAPMAYKFDLRRQGIWAGLGLTIKM